MNDGETVKDTLGETLARHLLNRIEKLEAAAGLEIPDKLCGHCLTALAEAPKEHWRKCSKHPVRSLPFIVQFLESNDQGYDTSSDVLDILAAFASQSRTNDILLKKARHILGVKDGGNLAFIEALNALVSQEPEKEN